MLSYHSFVRWTLVFCWLAFLSMGCAKPKASVDLPSVWIWDQNQTIINPLDGARHAWNGWVIQNGVFEAKEPVCHIVFWRQSRGLEKLTITYTLTGLPVALTVNVKKKPLLITPSSQMQAVTFEVQLKRGVNFLMFQKQAKDKLAIQSLVIGQPPSSQRAQLEAGESLMALFLPGRGRIEFVGKGELIFETTRSKTTDFETQVRSAKAGIFKRRIEQALNFDQSTLLTVRVAKGAFTVSHYAFQEKPSPPALELAHQTGDNPPVFIFLIDACQAYHMSLYGYPRQTTPNVDRLARDAVVYEKAYANASYTRSSVRSLFSGQYPERFGAGNLTPVGDNRQMIIPEFLKIKGYRTSIFTSAVTISPTFGFTRGIDDYFPFYGDLNKWKERRIDFKAFKHWLKRPGPLFSYFHFIEPHLPIVAPPPYLDMFKKAPGVPRQQRIINQIHNPAFKKHVCTPAEIQDIRDDYDSTIAYVDGEIGKALEILREEDLYDKSLIIMLSDHGEAMYEHGVWGHSSNVYDETVHVPLVIKFPSSLNKRGRVSQLVQITDIFPTMAALFGQRLNLPGINLLEIVDSGEVDDRITVSQSITETSLFGLRWRNWYAIVDLKRSRQQLYDLAADPAKDISDSCPLLNMYFLEHFLIWFNNLTGSETEGTAIDIKKLNPTEIENLKSLGYL